MGTVISYAGTTLPAGYLATDGSAISRTTYSDLFTAIGTTWGAGDGSTTFNVPDIRGRNLIGSGAGTTTTARTVGQINGEENHTLTTAEIPAHAHSVDPPSTATDSQGAHTHTVTNSSSESAGSVTDPAATVGSDTAGNTGSSGAHTHSTDIAAFNSASTGSASGDVTMPYIQLTYCQKTAGADLAEIYPVSDPSISAGDIVSFDGANPIFVKRAEANDNNHPLAGIISTQPGLLLTDKKSTTGERPVALSGRVPTKVNLEGGEISIGDRIALSSVAGVGKKAGSFDASVGVALEPYSATSTGGKIAVFINLQPGINIQALGREFLAHSAKSTTPSVDTNFDFVNELFPKILSELKNVGLAIEKGIVRITNLIADNLTIGSSGKPSGITLYDEDTGASYCVKIKGGQILNVSGECGNNKK